MTCCVGFCLSAQNNLPMEEDKDKLKNILKALEVKLKEPKNLWIFDELRRIVNNCDIADIRRTLNIRGVQSIDYSFVDEETVKNQLTVDNIRMENYAFDRQKETEIERFYGFCLNAFFQTENIVNYYLVKRFGNGEDLCSYVENHSKYMGDRNHASVEQIPISFKLYAICNELLSSEDSAWFGDLREVRNNGLHRSVGSVKCEKRIETFFAKENFVMVRERLKKLVSVIKLHIEGGFKEVYKVGIIKKVFPSMITIEIEKESFHTEQKLEGAKVGDKYKFYDVLLDGNKIKFGKYENL